MIDKFHSVRKHWNVSRTYAAAEESVIIRKSNRLHCNHEGFYHFIEIAGPGGGGARTWLAQGYPWLASQATGVSRDYRVPRGWACSRALHFSLKRHMLLTVIFAAFATTSVVADTPCSYTCKGQGCHLLSVPAASYTSRYDTCTNATATPIITSVDVVDTVGDSDHFNVFLMDKANYENYTNAQAYSYFGISGTSPYRSYTCFHTGAISYSAPVGPVYTVIYCRNSVKTCSLLYKVDITCKSADPCAGVNCNNGNCSGGSCICNSGYSGMYCNQSDCLSKCENGTCIGGSCICNRGYSGTYCNQSVCLKCDHGTCIGGSCICDSGYSGTHCDQNDCLSHCDKGHCSGAVCICDGGYSGTYCDRNDCLSNCKNGHCSGVTCICNSGYSGTYCDQNYCLENCKNGHCSGGTCICDSGYNGTYCDQNDCLSNCKNGHCSGGTCICDSGYNGTYCDQNDCLSNCKNGHCSGVTCICNSGYSGTYCEQKSCSSSCKNGHCSGDTCICKSGYSGTFCDQNDCFDNCENGDCSGGKCICNSGYSGTYCIYYSYIGEPLLIGLICGGIAFFLIIVVVVGVVLYKRRRRRSDGMELLFANEVTQ